MWRLATHLQHLKQISSRFGLCLDQTQLQEEIEACEGRLQCLYHYVLEYFANRCAGATQGAHPASLISLNYLYW